MICNFLSSNKDGVILSVKLIPSSSFSKIADYNEEYIRIKISSPPVDNRANNELIAFCSKLLDINKSNIKIISGEKSKIKKILFVNQNIQDITKKIMFVLNSL